MRSILLILLGTLAAQGQAQTVWTLERCLQQALEQNIDLQTTALNVTSAKWQWEQARHAQLPSFSLSAGQFLQSGRSIDRFTNQFVQSSISSNNFQAQGSWTLFAGQQIQAQKAGAELRYQAAGENQKSAEQALALNVATSYLQCLQALARFKASESQTANSQATLNRAQLQFDAQLINESELSNAKAQHQSNVARQTGAWNSYLSALQALQQFIRKPYDPDFRIDEGGLGLPSEQQGNTQPILPYSLQDLLNNAQERPDCKA
ncbi:MAG: TolC family protein, partial [Bacteroidia bacterium]